MIKNSTTRTLTRDDLQPPPIPHGEWKSDPLEDDWNIKYQVNARLDSVFCICTTYPDTDPFLLPGVIRKSVSTT